LSEESLSYDDLNGAACWARVMKSHYALSGITSSIMWNLLGGYYPGTSWYAFSMLAANQPRAPLLIVDDFDTMALSQQSRLWSQMLGAFEVHADSANTTNRVLPIDFWRHLLSTSTKL
jgi:hypothetical protein